MTTSRLLILVLAGFVISATATAQKLYKWVDEDGNVHYSDQVPPDQVEQAREELNTQGIVVERVERALTDEEKAALEAEKAAAEARARELEQRRAEDRKLLAIYASEADIHRSKEQQIESIDRSIEAAQAFIEGQSKSLASLLERAARQEDDGTEIGENLRKSIAMAQEQIRIQEEYIDAKEAERAATEKYYDAEIARYREITERVEESEQSADAGG